MTTKTRKQHNQDFEKRFSVGMTAEAKRALDTFRERASLSTNDALTLILENADLESLLPLAEQYRQNRERERLARRVKNLSADERDELRRLLDEGGNE